MPLVAKYLPTNERLNILHISVPDIRSKYKKDGIVCPYCESALLTVGGSIKAHHFRHKVACSAFDVKPESREHIEAKSQIYRRLCELRDRHHKDSVRVELEYRFPEAGKNGRIADIAQIFNTGHRMAYEVQLSPIPLETLQQRHDDYFQADIEDIWFFGPKMQTLPVQTWAEEHLSCGMLTIKVDYEEPRNFDPFEY